MTVPEASKESNLSRLHAQLGRVVSSLVGATIVVTTLDWPGLDVADQSNYLAAATALGLVLGVFWQLVARRDLADRLVLLALLAVVTGFLPLLVDGSRYRPATAHAALATVAGLVLAEQWLRWRSPQGDNEVKRRERTRPRS